MATPELQEFLGRLKSGDRRAVEELLRELDPFLRRAIRLRLLDHRLRRVLDTTDIYQSLLKDFLVRTESEQPVETRAGGLCAYLAAAVRHKIQTRLRKERRNAGSLPEGWETPVPGPSTACELEAKEFRQVVRDRLEAKHRSLFDLKSEGYTWTEIAAQCGARSDALRMRLRRAVATVLAELRC
jgi:DNA-directed RNA polymerase specialized sigma24 family protein